MKPRASQAKERTNTRCMSPHKTTFYKLVSTSHAHKNTHTRTHMHWNEITRNQTQWDLEEIFHFFYIISAPNWINKLKALFWYLENNTNPMTLISSKSVQKWIHKSVDNTFLMT